MNKDIDATLNALAHKQFGAVAWYQTVHEGLRNESVKRRVKWGIFREATPRVIVSTSAPDSFEQRATIARLDAGPGAAISVLTTLAWAGLPGFALEPIHISRLRTGRDAPPKGVVWHKPRLLLPSHVFELNGLVTTTPTRALADMLAIPRFNEHRAERALDNARSSRLTNHVLLTRMAGEWCERGRRGSTYLRDYLERKPADWVSPASNLARRFIALIVGAGMPEPRSEVNLGDEVAWLGRVDCLDPELPLIAEIDSEKYHTAPLDVAADGDRQDGLENGGFAFARFKEHEVWYEPRVVIDRWRSKRNEVRRSLGR